MSSVSLALTVPNNTDKDTNNSDGNHQKNNNSNNNNVCSWRQWRRITILCGFVLLELVFCVKMARTWPLRRFATVIWESTEMTSSSSLPYSLNSTIQNTIPVAIQTMQTISKNNNHTATIPKVIYIFWETGWPAQGGGDRARQANMVRASWEYFYPPCKNNSSNNSSSSSNCNSYQVVALDGPAADELSHRKRYIPNDDVFFFNMTVQARSDIYRTLLLYHHGGVWVDASLFANRPLEDWLHNAPQQQQQQHNNETDLATFQRFDYQRHALNIDPWITSWFLATPAAGYSISKIHDALFVDKHGTGTHWRDIFVHADMDRHPPEVGTRAYFAWHWTVSQVARTDACMEQQLRRQPDSSWLHGDDRNWFDQAVPVVKRHALRELGLLLHVARKHCGCGRGQRYAHAPVDHHNYNHTNTNPTTTPYQAMCATWNCTVHTANWHWLPQIKHLTVQERQTEMVTNS